MPRPIPKTSDPTRSRRAGEGQKARIRRREQEAQEAVGLMDESMLERRRRMIRERAVPPPGVNNASDPRSQMYVRVGKRWAQIITEIQDGQYTWEDFVESLDPEELARGQLRSVTGNFKGRPPKFIPRAFFEECQRELKRRFDRKLQQRVLGAVDEYISLSQNVKDPNLKERMLRYLMERVFGPVPKEVKVTQADPWETIITDILSSPPDESAKKEIPYVDRMVGLEEG